MPRAGHLWMSVGVTALLLTVSPAPGGPVGPRDASTNWLGQARRLADLAEYRFSPSSGGGYTAPNRAQGLRLRAGAVGVQVAPRRGDRASWELNLSLRGFGREGALAAAGPAEVSADGERVEQRRAALGLTEWYINAAGGIEHGFTIDARPSGGSEGSPLTLEIAYGGDLEARPAGDGAAVAFVTRDGKEALRYSGLMALDASGAEVESTLEVFPGTLRISVEDRGHRYPLIVDPTIVTPSWSALGDQFDGRFGGSVSAAGDVNGDGYGDVIVGAYQYDNGEFDEGRVFVYYGSSTGPSPLPAWTVEGNQFGAWLGYSVASAGDVNGDGYADVVVGAPLYDSGHIDEGRAFVYFGSSEGLGVVPGWTAESNQSGARLGASVASAGDVNGDGVQDLVVGAPLFDNGENLDEGRAFVYLGSFAGPSAVADWSAGSGLFSTAFGASVASAGDVNGDGYGDLIVGAPLFDAGGFFDEGRAFVFLGSGAGPEATAVWTADGSRNLARFGQSVAGAGDVNGDGFGDVIVGAPAYDSGRVFVYHGTAAGPDPSPDFTARMRGSSPAEFGAAVAGVGDLNGDGYGDVAVGAPRFGDSTTRDAGLVRAYFGGRNGLGNQPAFSATETQASAFLGGSVAAAGDVNGDGFADVIAGGIGLDNAGLFVANSGGAELYFGFRTRQTSTVSGALHGVRFTE